MSGHHYLAVLLLAVPCRAADVAEIVSRGAAALKSDFAATEKYAFIERDESLKNGRTISKTSQVVYIEGSDYYMPLAVDDRPLGPGDEIAEREKFRAEVARRDAETPEARRARIAKYSKARDANEALVRDFADAFTFELLREEKIDGRDAWVLSATAKKRAGPLSLAAKVLSGMKGAIWVDQATFHTIRAECDVVTPVPVYGILAKVLPGTHIEFRLAPVTDSTWLLSEQRINLEVSKLFFFRSTQVTASSYTSYRLNSEVLAELLSN